MKPDGLRPGKVTFSQNADGSDERKSTRIKNLEQSTVVPGRRVISRAAILKKQTADHRASHRRTRSIIFVVAPNF
jgi:hypothetical protein